MEVQTGKLRKFLSESRVFSMKQKPCESTRSVHGPGAPGSLGCLAQRLKGRVEEGLTNYK